MNSENTRLTPGHSLNA